MMQQASSTVNPASRHRGCGGYRRADAAELRTWTDIRCHLTTWLFAIRCDRCQRELECAGEMVA